MTQEQLKEALIGEWTQHLGHGTISADSDCKLVKEMEETLTVGIILWLAATESPAHAVLHLMISSCRLGYAFKCRELEVAELRKYEI